MTKSAWQKAGVMGTTALLVSIVLSLGAGYSDLPNAGEVASRSYQADSRGRVDDLEATEAARAAAGAAVAPIYSRSTELENGMISKVERFFSDITTFQVVTDPGIEGPTSLATTVPSSSTVATDPTTVSTSTTLPADTVDLNGRVYIDVDGDRTYDEGDDQGLADISVTLTDVSGHETVVVTDSDGSYRFPSVAVGTLTVDVDQSDSDFPNGFSTTGSDPQKVECTIESCSANSLALQPKLNPIDQVETSLRAKYPDLEPATITFLVGLAAEDVVIEAIKGSPEVPNVREVILDELETAFGMEIKDTLAEEAFELTLLERPPRVLIHDEPSEEGRASAADIIAMALSPNSIRDETKTQEAIQAARDLVPTVGTTFRRGDTIVQEGQTVSRFQRIAIDQLTIINAPRTVFTRTGVIAVLVALLAFYMARFRSDNWRPLRRVVLLALLLFLGAGAVTGTAIVESEATWYVLPAVAVGLMTSILFDPRVGALMGVAMAVMSAVVTTDAGLAVYALMATMAPIGFVSSISTRTATRTAVLFSALAAGVIAAAVAGFFHLNPAESAIETIGTSAAWAAGSSLVAGLVGLAAVQFLETAFDVTTAVRLLDLTDRNHAALQLLQEKAFGTFNHSLLVGTLADGAAKAVGANNLLARAAAYYHDLGKTENPLYFIENQQAMANPHDLLTPEESVAIIRRHVSDGLELAKKFKIPDDVSEGILTHHGDAIVRFFYEKARTERGSDHLNPSDFRHFGHKPQTAEMAILMLADSLEGACRANFQEEEPTPDGIKKVVERVIDEKVNDGQLSECSLTLAQLTKVQAAFVDALIGHYHQRIPYPNFPGS